MTGKVIVSILLSIKDNKDINRLVMVQFKSIYFFSYELKIIYYFIYKFQMNQNN